MKIQNVYGLCVVAVLAGACESTASSARRVAIRTPSTLASTTSRDDHRRCDATGAGRSSSEYDTNADGVPDVRKVFQIVGEGQDAHPVLICREVDLNHDGTKDMFRFYNDVGRTLREEEDRDFDGQLDVITYFDNGEVVRREFDSNRDGMIDMRMYYRDHRPYRAERELQSDNAQDFRPDYWEFYDSRGHVVRMGWDYDHDGRADRWDRTDRLAPLRVPLANASAAAAALPSDGTMGAPSTADAGVAPATPPGAATPTPATTPAAPAAAPTAPAAAPTAPAAAPTAAPAP